MAVYTLLDEPVLSAVLMHYDIGSLDHFEPVSSGIENTNYFVWTKKADQPVTAWVLTIFENLLETELPFFNRLTRHLYQQGFLVPAPLCLKSGCDYFFLPDLFKPEPGEKRHAEEDRGEKTPAARFGVIVPRFAGEARHDPGLEDCRQAASYIARMHLALERFPAIRTVDHSSSWFESHVCRLKTYLNEEDARMLDQAWVRYQTYIDDLDACPSGIVHGDLFRDNVLFDDGAISGVIDFYHAGFSPLLFDLAVMANDWALAADADLAVSDDVYDDSKLETLLHSYASIRPLTGIEIELWPRFLEIAAFRFWLSRLRTLHQPGYQQQIKQGNCVKSPDAMKRILLAAMAR
jgi:homoserine kinase type II